MKEKMKKMLMDAYKNPNKKSCFYSANLDKTNNLKLDNMEFWDWTPEKSRDVKGNNTCIFPLGLGCEKIVIDEDKEWAKPMFGDTESDYNLEVPDIYNGKTGAILSEIKNMTESLPEEEKIREPDIQSPLGIAEILCGQGLYIALMMYPNAIHKLLDKITTFEIAFIKEMKKIAGEKMNGACFPTIWNNQEGTLCSDDTLTLISPEMHLEFSIPYVNRIAEECGPLFYHSCTWREEHFDNIKQVKNVRAYNWNPGNSIDPVKIIKEFSGRGVLAPHFAKNIHLTEDTKKWGDFDDEVEMVKYFLDNMQDNTTFYFSLLEFDNHPELLEKFYELFYEYGYTPQSG